MSNKILEKLSGAHITIMTCAAILAPGALFAAVTFSNVALVNPTTGVAASVDGGGRVGVVDPYAFYRNYPGNQVDIFVNTAGTECETASQWAVPAGKAFIITAISGFVYQLDTTNNFASAYIYSGANCSTHLLTEFAASVSSTARAAPIAVDYGVGIPVAAGSTISAFATNNNGLLHIHGYLVPAASVSSGQIVGPVAAPGLLAGKLPASAR